MSAADEARAESIGTVARIRVERGATTEFPVAEKVRGGWQTGVHHYPDEMVAQVLGVYVHQPEMASSLDDPEVFCSRCLAGVDSSEHHEKCVATGYAWDGESAEHFDPGSGHEGWPDAEESRADTHASIERGMLGVAQRVLPNAALTCKHCGYQVEYRGDVNEQADRAFDHANGHYLGES